MQQKMIQFSGDVSLPAIGQGTWYMGEDASQRKTEVAALRAGIELGLTLIDTAEMYADGGAEKVVGEAAYSALFDHGLASKFDQRFASIRST
ncbi:aldo/keto reductase, partial [Shigella sonnei]|uniref:aldo/keto reductase n=2 Tax=Shigella sonnei TaxID=624 RepID=UPI0020960402